MNYPKPEHAAYMRGWRAKAKRAAVGAKIVAFEEGFAAAKGYDLNNPHDNKEFWEEFAREVISKNHYRGE